MYENSFLNSNLLQTLTMLFVGLFTFIIYFKKNRDELKNAATIIKLEIDNIESALGCLPDIVDSGDIEDIYKTTPIYQSLEWFKVRNLFIGKIDIEYISAINDFYEVIIICEDARSKMKEAIHCNRIDKIKYVQKEITSILKQVSQNDELSSIDSKLKKKNEALAVFSCIYSDDSHQFIFKSVETHYLRALEIYHPISNTVAYDKLKNIINKRSWLF